MPVRLRLWPQDLYPRISTASAGPRRPTILARRILRPEIVDRRRRQSWRHCRWKVFATGNTPPGLPRRRACSNEVRSSLLAATPPVTSNVATSCARAASSVLLTRSFTTACWNDATRSSVGPVAGGEIILARGTGQRRQGLATPVDTIAHVVGLHVAQDSGLDSAVGEVHARLVIGMAILRIAIAGA